MTEGPSLKKYYLSEIEKKEQEIQERVQNIKRLEAQRAELNSNVTRLKEELHSLHEVYSYVGEVVKVMGKKKVLVKVNPEGKYVVNLDKHIKIEELTPNMRVALKSDTYILHRILPTKVDPLVSLMKV